MIAYLRGRILDKQPNRIVVDVNGVGYDLSVPLSTFYGLSEVGGEVALRVHTHVREDALSLYGFATKLEQDLFSFIEVVRSNHELQRALDDAQAPAEAKSALALKLVPNASRTAQVLISQAVSAPRGLKPSALIERFVELVAKRQQRWIA